MKETDLFPAVKNWLTERHYEVYAEVPGVSGRADVIGRQGKILVNVELKKQLSFELLGQAIERKQYFHYVYIGIPKRKTHLPRLAYDIIRREGIGILDIYTGSNWASRSLPAKFNRPPLHHRINWDDTLRIEYKDHVGGGNGPHLWTPYKLMIKMVRNYLVGIRRSDDLRAKHGGHRNYGWVSIDEILNNCEADRHYSAPKPSLSNALRNIEHEWCEIKKEDGKLYYRAKEGTKEVYEDLS